MTDRDGTPGDADRNHYFTIRTEDGREIRIQKEGNASGTLGDSLASLPEEERQALEELMNQGASANLSSEINQALQDQIARELINPTPNRVDELLERVEDLERRVEKLEDTKPRQ